MYLYIFVYSILIAVVSQSVLAVPVHYTHISAESPCASLPNDILAKIASRADYADALSISLGNKNALYACNHTLKDKLYELYVGHTHSFLPAVKRCLMRDDVTCFDYVKKHFEAQEKVQTHHLAQLPALAAQLGAFGIFQSWGVDASHPHWSAWMTRAAVQCQSEFLKNVAGVNMFLLSPQKNPLAFYDFHSPLSSELDSPPYQTHLRMQHTCPHAQTNVLGSFQNLDMIRNQAYRVPSIELIVQVLQIHNLDERRAQLRALQASIKEVIAKGVYIIDDIVADTRNTLKLWWRYGQFLDVQDGGASDFVRWLIKEGSPISDLPVVREFATNDATQYHDAYERMLKMTVAYASGSSTRSLVTLMKLTMKTNPKPVLDALPVYKDSLHTNMFDPSVLKTLLLSLCNRYRIPTEGHNRYFYEIMTYYVRHGLRIEHLNLMKSSVQNLPQQNINRDTMLNIIHMFERLVKKQH